MITQPYAEVLNLRKDEFGTVTMDIEFYGEDDYSLIDFDTSAIGEKFDADWDKINSSWIVIGEEELKEGGKNGVILPYAPSECE